MTTLSINDIAALAELPGARAIAVENFLLSFDRTMPQSVHLANLAQDAYLYQWNAATVGAIRAGIRKAYAGGK